MTHEGIVFLCVLFATLEMLRGVVQPREANSSRSGNIRSTGQKDRRWKKSKNNKNKNKTSTTTTTTTTTTKRFPAGVGSRLLRMAHIQGGRDGDAVLLQLEVGVWVGDDVWGGGERGEEATRKYK